MVPPPTSDEVDRIPDGHHIVVDGRKWRATDTGIPDKLRAELVAELMRARRLVGSSGDEARPMVHDAKVALGERGEPWWEEPTDEGQRARLAATIRTLLRHRDGSSICPSDAARVVGALPGATSSPSHARSRTSWWSTTSSWCSRRDSPWTYARRGAQSGWRPAPHSRAEAAAGRLAQSSSEARASPCVPGRGAHGSSFAGRTTIRRSPRLSRVTTGSK